MKRWPVIIAAIMLLGTWGLLQSLSHGEQVPNKQPFSTFPLVLAERWQGKEIGIDADVQKVLRASDSMMRAYVPLFSDPRPLAPLYLFVGYYQSQRTGAVYHSPKNCLPGAGWQFVESAPFSVTASNGAPFTINRAVIQKGLDRQLILYWYHDRGRVIASEYMAKGYLIWDAMTNNRTDGAIVRISVPVVSTLEDAEHEATDFLRDLWPELLNHMPHAAQSA
jgi:EpsI family protein